MDGHSIIRLKIVVTMKSEYIYRYIPLSALFSTFGIIFPLLFHFFGLGSMFLPMFIPVLMGSTLLPPSLAVTIAILTPIISFFLTGMPPPYPPILFLVMLELMVSATLTSFFYYRKGWSIWITLLIALMADRLVLFLFVFFFARLLNFPERFYSIGVLLYGLPGIILILIVIPVSLKLLKSKYPQLVRHK